MALTWTAVANETVPAPTAAPTENSDTTKTGTPRSGNSGGLATGAEAAIIAGAVVGVLIAAVAGALLFLRWYRLRRDDTASQTENKSWSLSSLLWWKKREEAPAETNETADQEEKDPTALPVGVYELNGNYYGNEMYEEMFDMLDGNARAELAGKGLSEARRLGSQPDGREENERRSKEEGAAAREGKKCD